MHGWICSGYHEGVGATEDASLHQAELAKGRHCHHGHMVAQQLPDHRQQLVSVHAGQHHVQDHLQRNGGGPA